MRIQRQNKHGSWDTLGEGTICRISSDQGKYTYEFSELINENRIVYRVTIDTIEIQKVAQGFKGK